MVQHAVAEVVDGVAIADLGFGLGDEVGAGIAVDGDDAVACFERGLFCAAACKHMADGGTVGLLFGAAADVGNGRVSGNSVTSLPKSLRGVLYQRSSTPSVFRLPMRGRSSVLCRAA